MSPSISERAEGSFVKVSQLSVFLLRANVPLIVRISVFQMCVSDLLVCFCVTFMCS
jgi:hypothetical protein